jgi:diadenosine tetraphosphate (Ap4A) HIT family hydrolase
MNCLLCRGAAGDAELVREQVWQDDLWRLSTATSGEVLGFSYLEPRRHITDISALDGREAETFGPVLARVTSALKAATGAKLVYVYVFGDGIPHLHLHLAPHHDGDALNDAMIKGELESTKLPSGAELLTSKDYPPLPAEQHRQVRADVATLLADSSGEG